MSNPTKKTQKLDCSDDAEHPGSSDEMTVYEQGVQELFEKVPEMFENFKVETLDRVKYPTDGVLDRLIRMRDGIQTTTPNTPVD